MCERDDPQLRALDQVKNAIGKTTNRKASRHRAPRRSEVWMFAQKLKGSLKFGDKRKPQLSVRLFGVENCSVDELALYFRRDRDDHLSAARARAMASAAGTS